MIVLGISPLDRDATVSLVADGKVLFAAGEERFTRKKLQDGFPLQALQAGLRYTGLRIDDIDLVAYPFFDWQRERECIIENVLDEERYLNQMPMRNTHHQIEQARARLSMSRDAVPGLPDPNVMLQKPIWMQLIFKTVGIEGNTSRYFAKRYSRQLSRQTAGDHRKWQMELESHLNELGLLSKIRRFDHHLSHAANAFFASGFDRALIVTLDGYGSGLAGSVSIGEGTRIRRIHKLAYPYSLGTFYESVTSSLGLKPGRHEGKIVGLAAYGDSKVLGDVVLSRFQEEPGSFKIIESNNPYFSRYLSTQFPKVDIAAAYQDVLEGIATRYIGHYVAQTGIDTVVLSGGVTANVKMNQRIFEIPAVDRIFIYPNMGDGGCGTGGGFLASLDSLGQRQSYQTVYFGPEYSEQSIVDELRDSGLRFEQMKPIEPAIARLLHEGNVVARFNGRMEYGPRALGNRSILYRATDPAVNQWLNERLGRTEFMPFAPATLYEERHQCYRDMAGAELAAQFMTLTFNCTDFMKKSSPAAVHIDGTARPQLVREETNESYYRVLKEYFHLSGFPSIINTSFNMHEEPIVNSPKDAIRAFLDGNLDYLAIGDFLVKHPSFSVR